MAKKFEDKGKKEKKKEDEKKIKKKKMRKFNKDPQGAYLIKKLLKAGKSTDEIMEVANCSKQLVSKYRK